MALGIGLEHAHRRFAEDTPKKGGTFRLGMEGGSASDSLDPAHLCRFHPDLLRLANLERPRRGRRRRATPQGELAESWEAKPGATSWIFNIRKGVTFTSGKTLDADDVIYSLNLHRGETKSGAKDLLSAHHRHQEAQCEPDRDHAVERRRRICPIVFADYHVLIVPNGFTDFSKPDGTGAYRAGELRAGRARHHQEQVGRLLEAGPRQFRQRRAALHPRRRRRALQALISGQIDARQPARRQDGRLRHEGADRAMSCAPRAPATASPSWRCATPIPTPATTSGSRSNTASIARRSSTPSTRASRRSATTRPSRPRRSIYAKDMPQRPYDPEKAAFHFKKAGMANAKLELQVSEGAFSGATDARRALSGGDEEGGPRSSGQARLRRRLLGQCLAEGAVLRGVLGRPPDRGQSALADLPVDGELERHPWKRPDFDKLHHRRPAPNSTRPSAAQMYADAQKMIVRRRRHGLLRHRRLSRRLWQEGQGHRAASPLRHVRSAHRRKGLVRVNRSGRLRKAEGATRAASHRNTGRPRRPDAPRGLGADLRLHARSCRATSPRPCSASRRRRTRSKVFRARARARPARLCALFRLAVRRTARRFRPRR